MKEQTNIRLRMCRGKKSIGMKKIFLEDCPTSSDISEENNDIVFTNIIYKGGYFTKQRSIGKEKKEINK